MFEGSLIASTSTLQVRSRWPALISFILQAVVASALIGFPVLYPEILPLAAPGMTLVAPRLSPPPIQVRPVRVQATSAATLPSDPIQVAHLLSRRAFESDATSVDRPLLQVGVDLGERGSSPLSALTQLGTPGPRVYESGPVESGSVAKPSTAVVNVSRGVSAGMLIAPIRPEYPAIARISRTEGTVVVEAIISETGHIESAHVISGPQMLQPAALQAIRDARYHPFLLNDRPTEVQTTISIVFRLGS